MLPSAAESSFYALQPHYRIRTKHTRQYTLIPGPVGQLCRWERFTYDNKVVHPFFPVLYTIGVLVSLAGTGFLIGVCYSTFPVLSVAQLSFDAVRHSD